MHTVQMGDVERDPDKQVRPHASLRKPGETIPADDGKDARVGVMRPVQFPKRLRTTSERRPNGQLTPRNLPADPRQPPLRQSMAVIAGRRFSSTPAKPQPAANAPPNTQQHNFG